MSVNEAPNDQKKWEGLLRGTVLSTTTQKLFNYIALADQKAMAIVILNSIIVPIAISGLEVEHLKLIATLCILTSVLSILLAIICLFPRRRHGFKPDGTRNYFHFSDIGRLKEHDYLEQIMPIYNDPGQLSREVLKDIHDASRRIIIPKFFWLRLSYITFFLGNLISITLFLESIWM